MAKKKKKVGTHHRRRKKMGAIKQDGSLEALAGGVIGFIGAYVAEAQIQSLSAPALATIQVLGGGAIAYFPKNWFVKGIGIGIAANGAQTAAENFGLISGIGSILTMNDPTRAGIGAPGFRNVARLGQFLKPAAVGNSTEARMARMYGSVYAR